MPEEIDMRDEVLKFNPGECKGRSWDSGFLHLSTHVTVYELLEKSLKRDQNA